MMAAVDQNNPSHQVELVFLAAWFHLNMREYERAEALAARAVELSEQHPFTNYADVARFFLGAARAHLGRATDGIALLREGGAGMLRSGVRVPNGFYLALLAEAHNREGDTLAALETIDQALEPSTVYRPEVLRIRGELRAKQGQIELAENDLRDAIALAQKMSAKSWELRTTMSLARLLRDKGGRDQARAMLAEIYNWFTEGFDTADLKEAKALLDELRV